jgi:hypothetical protein
MFRFLKRVISRFMGASSSGELPPATPPHDPDLGVRQPRKGGRPGGRSAVAVAEPEEARDPVDATSRKRAPRLPRPGDKDRHEG